MYKVVHLADHRPAVEEIGDLICNLGGRFNQYRVQCGWPVFCLCGRRQALRCLVMDTWLVPFISFAFGYAHESYGHHIKHSRIVQQQVEVLLRL